jgi:hypothetical protein
MKSGKFIVLEGADGSGKSSQSKALLSGYNTLGAGLSAVMILVQRPWEILYGTFYFTAKRFDWIPRLKCFSIWHLGLN